MKNRLELLRVLPLLALTFFLTPAASAQPVRDVKQDIQVSFTGRPAAGPFSSVSGSVRNRSVNLYRCVNLTFDLHADAGPQARHLGAVTVKVEGLEPRAERDYEQPLPSPSGDIRLKSVAECPKEMPGGPKVLSLTAEPPRLTRGQTATIRWETENAEQVFVGEPNPAWSMANPLEPVLAPRAVDVTGSLPVTPTQTTTYRLQVKKGGMFVFKDVTVEVGSAPPPPGFCTISGEVRRDKPEYMTRITLRSEGAPAHPPRSATVDTSGRYTFSQVPEGTYVVMPRGRYPVGDGKLGSLAPSPPSQRVVCEPNGSHSADFVIKDTEG